MKNTHYTTPLEDMMRYADPVAPYPDNVYPAMLALIGICAGFTLSVVLADIANEVLTGIPNGAKRNVINYLAGKLQTSINDGFATSCRYCSYVIKQISGEPLLPLGPPPTNELLAVGTYAISCAEPAQEAVIANDAVYCDPVAKGYTLNISVL